jgi:hypothetical protein
METEKSVKLVRLTGAREIDARLADRSSLRTRRSRAALVRVDSPAKPERPDPRLPLFSYGVFKEDELAFGQIEDLVAKVVDADVSGALYVRDGLPLLVLNDFSRTDGDLIRFRQSSPEAYERVSELEPSNQYRWAVTEVNADGRRVRANVLIGIDPTRGGIRLDGIEWSSAHDPVFVEAMGVARQDAIRTLKREGRSPEFDFFRLQALFLLVSSCAEHLATLTIAGKKGFTERFESLETLPSFRSAFDKAGVRPDRPIFDARDPARAPAETGEHGEGAWGYWYRIRSNVAHRGKGVFGDIELIARSLVGMHDVLRLMLAEMQPRVVDSWRSTDPDGEASHWLLGAALKY